MASHALGLAAVRVSRDWQRQYGHGLELLENFVDRERFRGTCYQAAGWQHVGTTTGRTRNDDGLRPAGPGKEISLKPLRVGWKERLAA